MWLTFFPELSTEPLANGFGSLAALNEGLLPPEGTMLTYSRRGSEIITYVVGGTLSHKDVSSRQSCLLHAGDFQRSNAHHSEQVSYSNASVRDALHVVQLSLFAESQHRRPRAPEQRSFPAADRVGGLRLVGSRDGRLGSLKLDQDASVYSGVFGTPRELAYRLDSSRVAWIQVVRGNVDIDGISLAAGDGAGVSTAGDLRLRTSSAAELVLLDLSGSNPRCLSHTDGHAARRIEDIQGGAAAHG